MTVQILGHHKCNDTKKALRFFKERNIECLVKNVRDFPCSRGELENISRSIPAADLVDVESKLYKSGGYSYREFDPVSEIMEHPDLMKTPVVRCGKAATVGYQPETWVKWIAG
jgi:arsenate reductase